MKTRMLIAILCSSSASIAAVYTNAWDVDLQRNPPAVIDVWRGETVALCARTGLTNLPASAEFLWQSPGMGTSWYSTNAVAVASGAVTAVFAPAMDSGAASYSFFFRVGSGDLYRPRGTLKMQGSPGAVPNEIPIPPRVLDFAIVTVLNPPWATLTDVDAAISDALEGYEPGGGGVIEESDPVAATWQTNHLATANPHGITPAGIGAVPGTAGTGGHALGVDIYRGGDIARTTLSAGGVAVKLCNQSLLKRTESLYRYIADQPIGMHRFCRFDLQRRRQFEGVQPGDLFFDGQFVIFHKYGVDAGDILIAVAAVIDHKEDAAPLGVVFM